LGNPEARSEFGTGIEVFGDLTLLKGEGRMPSVCAGGTPATHIGWLRALVVATCVGARDIRIYDLLITIFYWGMLAPVL